MVVGLFEYFIAGEIEKNSPNNKIEESRELIKEVALDAGYKSASNFQSHLRKKFWNLPNRFCEKPH